MSIESHPNFHVVNFVTQVMSAYYDSLRGAGVEASSSSDIRDEVMDFVEKIEAKVDKAVKEAE